MPKEKKKKKLTTLDNLNRAISNFQNHNFSKDPLGKSIKKKYKKKKEENYCTMRMT